MVFKLVQVTLLFGLLLISTECQDGSLKSQLRKLRLALKDKVIKPKNVDTNHVLYLRCRCRGFEDQTFDFGRRGFIDLTRLQAVSDDEGINNFEGDDRCNCKGIERIGSFEYKESAVRDGSDNEFRVVPLSKGPLSLQNALKYEVNDDLDIAVLTPSDFNKLLSNLHNKKRKSKSDPLNLLQKRLLKLQMDELWARRTIEKINKEKQITPLDLAKYLLDLHTEIIDYSKDYIRNKQNDSYTSLLDEKYIDLIKEIKSSKDVRTFTDAYIKQRLTDSIFKKNNLGQVIAHEDKNDNIYVPRYLYNALQQYTNPSVRSKHRILPLTKKQRDRMLQRKRTRKSNFVQYKEDSVDSISEKYGFPFELNIEALGQVNA